MKKSFLAVLLSIFLFGVLVTVIKADHSWGNYHWARMSNPFTLKLGNNLTSDWQPYLSLTSSDWSASSVLDTVIATGGGGKNCRPTSGRVEVCNRKYGNNGWLGVAQIWVSGDHIVQGVTKVNDTYFDLAPYNSPSWKNMVMCQEVGHTFGLDHQDEDFDNDNMGTCMDYSADPAGPPSNEQPDAHDYDMLSQIYAHLDSFSSVDESEDTGEGGGGGGNGKGRGKPSFVGFSGSDNPSEWGRSIKDNGRVALFERNFGGGNKVFTFVIWAR